MNERRQVQTKNNRKAVVAAHQQDAGQQHQAQDNPELSPGYNGK